VTHERRETGAIFADHMTGQQARMELMLALGVHGGDVEAIRNVVEAGRYEH
jgi:L-asparaginase/Glu-tRNA(Gln) amidotransferase subunit D